MKPERFERERLVDHTWTWMDERKEGRKEGMKHPSDERDNWSLSGVAGFLALIEMSIS